MEAIGSEVGLKMRSAIKAKLMELGCYVDDELPDYVMVMVANKRTRSQMEEDLQLFLSQNTEAFVGWLHQVLQKLQEVTINTKMVSNAESKVAKIKSSIKKEKKRDKEKSKSKERIKTKKSKKERAKKSEREPDRIRLNVPPLLMNLEKESSPSITDVFAGQILRKHGILPAIPQSLDTIVDNKNLIGEEIRKPSKNRLPIIDPATVSNIDLSTLDQVDSFDIPPISVLNKSQVIEAMTPEKKQTKGNDSDSDSEDFINLRTEADDFAGLDDETSKISTCTPPLPKERPVRKLVEAPSNESNQKAPEKALHIELNLPKRPLRERLGVREDPTTVQKNDSLVNSVQSITHKNHFQENGSSERLEGRMHVDKFNNAKITNPTGNIKSRLTLRTNNERNDLNINKKDTKKKLVSRVVSKPADPPETDRAVAVASVIRAPPRHQNFGVSAAPQLLLRAMAEAHKSLLNMPPKPLKEPTIKKKPIVLPKNKYINPKKIIIEVPSRNINLSKSKLLDNIDSNSDFEIDMETESLEELESERDSRVLNNDNEYIPEPVGNKPMISKDISYIPTHIENSNKETDDESSMKNIEKSPPKDPQFVVTLDGLDPNVFLEKKLEMLDKESAEDSNEAPSSETKSEKCKATIDNRSISESAPKNITITFNSDRYKINRTKKKITNTKFTLINNLSTEKDAGEEDGNPSETQSDSVTHEYRDPQRKRKGSPIIFNSNDIKTVKTKVKTDSYSNKVNKYDSMISLPLDNVAHGTVREKCKYFPDCKLGASCDFYHPPANPPKPSICRSFPACPYGDKCLYTHPSCKFDSSCVRVDCPYSHAARGSNKAGYNFTPTKALGNNYKTAPLQPVCKYYPNCSKYDCGWYHPTACKFGKKCANKSDCSFYHHDVSALKWKSPKAT